MKKRYIAPEVVVVVADYINIMAGSPLGTNTKDQLTDGDINGPGTGEEDPDKQPIGAKQHSSWSAWDTWD